MRDKTFWAVNRFSYIVYMTGMHRTTESFPKPPFILSDARKSYVGYTLKVFMSAQIKKINDV